MKNKDEIPNINNDNEQEYWQEFKNTQFLFEKTA